MLTKGSLRTDLYYRINVISIFLPPLRERVEDVGPLVDFFLRKYLPKDLGEEIRVSPEVMDFFITYKWPGNVRELQHVLQHALVMMDGNSFEFRHLPTYLRSWTNDTESKEKPRDIIPKNSFRQSVRNHEKTLIAEALEKTHYNRTKAIELLKMSRRTFYKKLKEFEIET